MPKLIFMGIAVILFGCAKPPPETVSAEVNSLPYYLVGYEKYGTDLQGDDKTIRASSAAYEWYRDATFGMFIHWGLYSVEKDHEWEMQRNEWQIEDYEKLAIQFNPTEFNAREWASAAKSAGMNYIVITTKHHDGFALWNTQQGDWNIMDRTPYKKDVIKALAAECQKQGIAFGLYYSHLDWYHPEYYPRGETGWDNGRAEAGDFDQYLDYLNAQVAELSSGEYGPIASFWFDGVWDIKEGVDWRLKETYDIIHNNLPHAMIGNNRFSLPQFGEDYQIFERSLPGHDTYKHNTREVSEYPLESADTMNKHWGYNEQDQAFKSTKQLVHYLVRAAGNNGNLLLNVGPPPSGKFQDQVVQGLRAVGEWNQRFGESIFKTRGGPMAEQTWGVMTQGKEGGKTYLHILETPGSKKLDVPIQGQITGVKLFGTDVAVPFSNDENLQIDLSAVALHEIDTILVIEKQGVLKKAHLHKR
ncbi:MAG: alpha-L-fucosidase [Porticoccaceae bacterium]|nr:alpha-L-fucosidase [Porticoccaceae bacterium]